MFIYLNKRGQSTLEYGVIIAVVVAGLIAMQAYVKRGLQGRLRGASDDIGEQFSPEQTTLKYDSASTAKSTEIVNKGKTTTTTHQEQERTGKEEVSDLGQESMK